MCSFVYLNFLCFPQWIYVVLSVLVLSRVWLCDSRDCSPPGSSVHGICQARMGWVAISSSRWSSLIQRSKPHLSHLLHWQVDFFFFFFFLPLTPSRKPQWIYSLDQNTGVGSLPSPRDLPNSGIKPRSPTLQVDSLPTEAAREALLNICYKKKKKPMPSSTAFYELSKDFHSHSLFPLEEMVNELQYFIHHSWKVIRHCHRTVVLTLLDVKSISELVSKHQDVRWNCGLYSLPQFPAKSCSSCIYYEIILSLGFLEHHH